MAHFAPIFHALGPFAIGTREDPWRDSIDIGSLSVSTDRFASALGCVARWKALDISLDTLTDSSTRITLELSYSEIDWPEITKIYGWVATQFDAWSRCTLIVEEDCVVHLKVLNSPEFLLDGERYEGDIYGVGIPLIVPLTIGHHQLDIRVVNEVRIFGYTEEPLASIIVDVDIKNEQAFVTADSMVVPDTIRTKETGRVVRSSPYIGFVLNNNSAHTVQVDSIIPGRLVRGVNASASSIAPYQGRSFVLDVPEDISFDEITVDYTNGSGERQSIVIPLTSSSGGAASVSFLEPQIITYLNHDKTIGRAVVRAPLGKDRIDDDEDEALPVILSLHGAGVNIANRFWKDVYKETYHGAWILQPDCGLWGDDWHSLSALSIDCAIQAVTRWITNHEWTGPGIDFGKILVMGHSNGAHGAMQFMVRNSDRIIGAAFAAGYTSIASYVPQSLWTTNAKPQADRPEFDIVRNLEMIEGIKTFVRHGVEDDNVPIYHSRLLASMAPWIALEEIPKQGHWYDGILTKGRIHDFVQECLDIANVASPSSFTVLSWGRPVQRGQVLIDRIQTGLALPARLHVERSEHGQIKSVDTTGVASWHAVGLDPAAEVSRTFAFEKAREKAARLEGQPLDDLNLSIQQYDRRDVSVILESTGPISILAPYVFGHRIAHSLLLYHNLDSELLEARATLPATSNAIVLCWGGLRDKMSIEVKQLDHRAVLYLTAPDDASMSKLIRLIPWRTGVGVSGRTVINLKSAANLVDEAEDVEFVSWSPAH